MLRVNVIRSSAQNPSLWLFKRQAWFPEVHKFHVQGNRCGVSWDFETPGMWAYVEVRAES